MGAVPGRDVAQAASGRGLTAEARDRARVGPRASYILFQHMRILPIPAAARSKE
jgi:hypothetical protein